MAAWCGSGRPRWAATRVSYLDLPGGYYPLEVRLVDRNGNVINSEVRDINNLNFASGQNSWHVTVGQEMNTGENLVRPRSAGI